MPFGEALGILLLAALATITAAAIATYTNAPAPLIIAGAVIATLAFTLKSPK